MALPAVIGAIGRVARTAGGLGGGGGGVGGAGGGGGGNLFNKVAATAFNVQAIAGALGSLGQLAQFAVPGLAHLNVGIRVFTTGLNLVQAPIVGIVSALSGFRDAVGATGTAVSEFVKFASPGHVQLFNIAMEDLTATIGKMLIPVLEMSTKFVRLFADVLWNLSDPVKIFIKQGLEPLDGVFKGLMNALDPLVRLLTMQMKVSMAMLSPVLKMLGAIQELSHTGLEAAFKLLGDMLEAVAPVVMFMASVLDVLLGSITNFIRGITQTVRGLFGLRESRMAGSSVGAAVRPAQITSVEEYGRKAQQAAFSLGTAATPEATTAEYMEKLYNFFKNEFWTRLLAMVPKPPGLPPEVVDAGRRVGDGALAVADGVIPGFGAARRALGELLPW